MGARFLVFGKGSLGVHGLAERLRRLAYQCIKDYSELLQRVQIIVATPIVSVIFRAPFVPRGR
jgi:hypothetical protein